MPRPHGAIGKRGTDGNDTEFIMVVADPRNPRVREPKLASSVAIDVGFLRHWAEQRLRLLCEPMPQRAAALGFTHLIADTKRDPNVMRRIEQRVRSDYPQHYARCIAVAERPAPMELVA
jgi:hypothetical protein